MAKSLRIVRVVVFVFISLRARHNHIVSSQCKWHIPKNHCQFEGFVDNAISSIQITFMRFTISCISLDEVGCLNGNSRHINLSAWKKQSNHVKCNWISVTMTTHAYATIWTPSQQNTTNVCNHSILVMSQLPIFWESKYNGIVRTYRCQCTHMPTAFNRQKINIRRHFTWNRYTFAITIGYAFYRETFVSAVINAANYQMVLIVWLLNALNGFSLIASNERVNIRHLWFMLELALQAKHFWTICTYIEPNQMDENWHFILS